MHFSHEHKPGLLVTCLKPTRIPLYAVSIVHPTISEEVPVASGKGMLKKQFHPSPPVILWSLTPM